MKLASIKFRFLAFLRILLIGSPLVYGQNDEEAVLESEIDSLYGILFTFNYSDESSYEPAFSNYHYLLDSIMEVSARERYLKAYYRGANIKSLHFKYQDELKKSRQVLDETINYALENGDSLYFARFTFLIGTLFSRTDDDDSALVYFEKSLNLGRRIKSKAIEGTALNGLAVIYAKLGRDDLALTYYQRSFQMARASGDSSQMLTTIGNLATVYGRMGIGDSVLYYGTLGYNLASTLQETSLRRQSLNSLTIASYLKKDFEGVLTYSSQLEDDIKPVGETGYLITSYLYRSKALAALGRVNEAFHYASESLNLAREFEITTNELKALKWLVTLAEENKRFEEAFKYERQRASLQDSLNQDVTNKRIEKLSTQYETREKEDKIAALGRLQQETEARQRTQKWLFGVISLLFIISFLYVLKVFRSRVERERVAQQKTKNELLRTQLNPHFLFNALSSIQLFLIDKGQGSHALNYLSKFAKLMRRILENSRRDLVSLDAEISTLRHYLDLQKIRFDNGFEYKIEVITEDDTSEIMIPPMFAQPFIENSLEHGISDMDNGLIRISFEQQSEVLIFKVEDNGVGLSRTMSLKNSRAYEPLATQITQDRVELLRKQLKRNISFKIMDKLNEGREVIGTEVIFELPIQYNS